MIIDSHTHLFDVFTGYSIESGIVKYPFGITMLLEWLGFKKGNRPPNKLIKKLALYDNLNRSKCGTVENLLLYMEKNKINYSLVWSIEPFVTTNQILEISKKYSQILTVGSINIFNNNNIDIIKELEVFDLKEIYGLKIHPIIQKINPESKLLFNIVEEYQKFNKPIFLHTGSSSITFRDNPNYDFGNIDKFEKIVSSFKNQKFVFGHMGNNNPLEAINLAEKYDNIILETSYQNHKIIELAINQIGIDRIIYGSDFPYARQKYALKEIYKLNTSQENKNKILYLNILNIINKNLED